MKKKTYLVQISVLVALALTCSLLFLTYHTYGNWDFALKLRGKKIVAFILVALASSISTISFQTITKNQFLTPGVLGLDNLYVLVQTLLFFFIGGIKMLSQETIGMFLLNILLMTALSVTFMWFFLDRLSGNLFLLLMVGMISGTFFSSISTYLQVLMDPNEYDLLQGKLFASFSNVHNTYLWTAAVIILVAVSILWYFTPELDVLHLGREQAVNLGVNVPRMQMLVLLLVSLLTGVSTALVGPTIFLGFVLATVSYRLFATFHHRNLFIGSFLLGIIFLVGGQFLVEQVFGWNTTISIVIQFTGGIFFIGKILAERKKS